MNLISQFNLKSILILRFRDFFNKYTGYWIPSCVAISVSISGAIADPESHKHLSFGNVITVPLNMADAKEIFISACLHIDHSVNGQRSRTFIAIESEVPTFAAAIAFVNSQCTRPVNMKRSIREDFGETTALQKIQKKKDRKSINGKRLGNKLFHVPWHPKPRSSLDLIATAQCAILIVVVVDRQIKQLIDVEAGLTLPLGGWIYPFLEKGT